MKREPPIYQPNKVEIPESVLFGAKEGCLSFFIGNGLSRLFGVPSWEGLADQMLDQLARKAVINHSDASLLKAQPLKVKFSIADYYFKRNNRKEYKDFKEGVSYKEMLSKSVVVEENRIYKSLSKCGAKFITTNYDTFLDEALIERFKSQSEIKSSTQDGASLSVDSTVNSSGSIVKKFLIFNHPSELRKSAFVEQNVLLHLHGSVASLDSESNIIASSADYLSLYTNIEVMENLRDLLKDQILVFLGYSLDELEVLELILRSSMTREDHGIAEINKRFLLLPVMSHEAPLLKHLSIYWEEQLGIKILAYSIDIRGYNAIEEVIESWVPILEKESNAPSRVQHINLIDEIMDNFDRAEK